ncbi:Uncharacterised protein [Salmonella enterica subsp. arizonae]|uniref:Uncharacterized protein n=1 Tax=Salmonella enterica subsp. arizonae TaxID=59203 RepID=A0A379T514_SALER|nr:Uncharacterised protein [Salmonella enterica subsp. arizonae]
MMQLKPLQSNDCGCVVDFPLFLPTGMPAPGLPHEPEYLRFHPPDRESPPRSSRPLHPTRIDERSLGSSRTCQVTDDRPDAANGQPRLFHRLTPSDRLNSFAFFYHAGDHFQQPRRNACVNKRQYESVRPAPPRRAQGQKVARRRACPRSKISRFTSPLISPLNKRWRNRYRSSEKKPR